MSGRGGVRHEQVGDDLYKIIVLPEGDHYRWTVSRSDMSAGAKSHFAEQIATGPAEDEHLAWTRGKAALNRFLVKKYLEWEFPGATIHEFFDSMRGGHGFRVQNSESVVVEVSDVFVEDYDSKRVGDTLRSWGLAEAMHAAGKEKFVMVTTEGLRSDSRRKIAAD